MAHLSKADREEHFKKCNRKNPEVEISLSSDKETNVDCSKPNTKDDEGETVINNNVNVDFFKKIVGLMKDNELRRLKINEKNGNHSNILVKNKYIPRGWSIFEPNSIFYRAYNIINDKDQYITKQYFTVSPQEDSINYPLKDSHNPGYCGMFGIIFMVYFRMHKDDP
jgi:hypothetical protein